MHAIKLSRNTNYVQIVTIYYVTLYIIKYLFTHKIKKIRHDLRSEQTKIRFFSQIRK